MYMSNFNLNNRDSSDWLYFLTCGIVVRGSPDRFFMGVLDHFFGGGESLCRTKFVPWTSG